MGSQSCTALCPQDGSRGLGLLVCPGAHGNAAPIAAAAVLWVQSGQEVHRAALCGRGAASLLSGWEISGGRTAGATALYGGLR